MDNTKLLIKVQMNINTLPVFFKEISHWIKKPRCILPTRCMHVTVRTRVTESTEMGKDYSHVVDQRFQLVSCRTLKTCSTWLLGALTSFPWCCQIKSDNSQHNNSCPVWMLQNYTYFLVRLAKIYNFLVCLRILAVGWCVPWDEKGWKSLW